MSEPILIAAPMGIELRGLLRRMPKSRQLKKSPYDARETELEGKRIITARVGISRISCEKNLRPVLDRFSPSRVYFIGISGALRPEFRVGDPFVISAACQWSGDSSTLSLERAVSLQEIYQDNRQPRIKEIKGRRRVRRARILTVDNFVNTAKEKRRLGAAGFDLVDMEFAAAAKICAEKRRSLTGLKVVSDTLSQSFPSFHHSTVKKSRGLPPPRLAASSMRACKILGRFVFGWLLTELTDV